MHERMNGFSRVGARVGEHDFLIDNGKRTTLYSAAVKGAYAFTFSLISAFCAPFVLSTQLGADPDVAFWIGRGAFFALLLPPFFVAQHVVHMALLRRGRPKKMLLMASFLLPAVGLCVVGGTHMSKARYLHVQLTSEDCSGAGGLVEKSMLEVAFGHAQEVYDHCSKRLVKENDGVQLQQRMVLQACEEWTHNKGFLDTMKNAAQNKTNDDKRRNSLGSPAKGSDLRPFRPGSDYLYSYLANVEMNHHCGGFCTPGPMLWFDSNAAVRPLDTCAPLVGLKFSTVERQCELLFWTSAAAGIFGIFGIAVSKPMLDQLGYS
mmetsp:Transcript_41204/g.113662  ORF Transcript_41204/g.113662 Transcript_41204/m.113662 type:complete len:319 (+) Transcript_41204:153-1109(+)